MPQPSLDSGRIDRGHTEIREFRRALRVLEREIELSLNRETECCDVSAPQCHLLLETERRSGASLTELAEELALDKSTLSRTVEALSHAGLITRGSGGADRRRTAISLTEAGREKVESINKTCDNSYLRLFGYIPEAKRSTVVEAASLLAEAMRRKRKDEGAPCCDCADADERTEEA